MEIVIKQRGTPCWVYSTTTILIDRYSKLTCGHYATHMVYGNKRDADGIWESLTCDMYLTPTPGNEDKVRRFVALGRLKNPDFPFVIKESDAD